MEGQSQIDHKKLSRRQLLKAGGLTLVGSLLGGGVTKKAGSIVEYVSRNNDVLGLSLSLAESHYTNLGIAVSEQVTKKTPQPNPQRRPILEIIKEGVSLYGAPVHYHFNPQRKPDNFWEQRMGEIAKDFTLVDMIKIASGDIESGFKIQNDYTRVLYDRPFMEKTGTVNLYYYSASIDMFSDIARLENSSFSQKSDGDIQKKLQQVRSFVEEQAINGPLSASTLLSYFLGETKGDLSMAIEDTALFLKLFARNNLETAKDLADTSHEDAVQETTKRYEMIRDEYLPVGTHFMEDITKEVQYQQPDLDTNNLLGAAYHAWNIVATLRMLPPRTTAKGAVLRTVQAYVNQGDFKLASDIGIARQVNQLEEYFRSLD